MIGKIYIVRQLFAFKNIESHAVKFCWHRPQMPLRGTYKAVYTDISTSSCFIWPMVFAFDCVSARQLALDRLLLISLFCIIEAGAGDWDNLHDVVLITQQDLHRQLPVFLFSVASCSVRRNEILNKDVGGENSKWKAVACYRRTCVSSPNIRLLHMYQSLARFDWGTKRWRMLLVWSREIRTWVMRTIYNFFTRRAPSRHRCVRWCTPGDHLHTCRIQPNNTQSVQHIWFTSVQSRIAINQPCLVVCVKTSLRVHAINIFKKFFFFLRVTLKCKLRAASWLRSLQLKT